MTILKKDKGTLKTNFLMIPVLDLKALKKKCLKIQRCYCKVQLMDITCVYLPMGRQEAERHTQCKGLNNKLV